MERKGAFLPGEICRQAGKKKNWQPALKGTAKSGEVSRSHSICEKKNRREGPNITARIIHGKFE
jgi:hypothetical protein